MYWEQTLNVWFHSATIESFYEMDLYVSAVAIEMVSSSIHGFINVISIERFVMRVSVSEK
jgi:hypothetical protein